MPSQPIPSSAEIAGTGGTYPIPYAGIVVMCFAFLYPDPEAAYEWWEWRFLPNNHWFIKNIIRPDENSGPYSQPVVCEEATASLVAEIVSRAGITVSGDPGDEVLARLAVEALVAPLREAQT